MIDSVVQSPHSVTEPVAGSFRDPSGFVLVRDDVLYRQVNHCYRAEYDHLVQSGLGAELMRDGLLISHREAVPWAEFTGFKLLEPERVPFISYPYEWSFSQWRDAALLTLAVQTRALRSGMWLKDASAYNVQFVRARPILIDTLSFERYPEGRPWVAYRQFCQHFLAPLALMSYRDVRLGQLLRPFIDGVPLDMASVLLPWRTRLRPSLLVHLHLHARMQKRYAGTPRPAAARRSLSRTALEGLMENLASAIRGLRWKPEGTEWADYYCETNYSDRALDEKERLVADMLDRLHPATVWDLGANTGRFSRLASRRGATTVAFDLDPAAVDRAYLAVAASKDEHMLPLVLDLTNPSPSLGWAGEERQSLQARGPADVALALALVHHLAIGNNVPLDRIAAFLAGLARHLVIEFVPKTDSQVQRMLASRADVFDRYTREDFERAFDRWFVTEQVEPIAGTERVLYCMCRRRTGDGLP